MEKNVFLQQQNSNSTKYNPDISYKYNVISNEHSKPLQMNYTNEYYKSVTNIPIVGKIKSAVDLKLPVDVPNTQKYVSDLHHNILIRNKENELVSKAKQEYNMKNNIFIKTATDIDKYNEEHVKEIAQLELLKHLEIERKNLELYNQREHDIKMAILKENLIKLEKEQNNDPNMINYIKQQIANNTPFDEPAALEIKTITPPVESTPTLIETITNSIETAMPHTTDPESLKHDFIQFNIKEQDKMKKHKQKFNDILNDLDKLF